MFVLSLYLFSSYNLSWWWFAGLLLSPDISMLAYLINPRIGAAIYNLAHHKGVAISVYLIGIYLKNPGIQLAGIILFAHSSMDRIWGYGLKFPDSFNHTHLGIIGNKDR
jgi:hypothetical protein